MNDAAQHKYRLDSAHRTGSASPPTCPLCGRPFGKRVEKHHLIPRLKGGTETVPLHPICHRKIHSLFSEAELAQHFNTISALKAHPEIAAFIRWLWGKPPDFHAPTRGMKKGISGAKGARGRRRPR